MKSAADQVWLMQAIDAAAQSQVQAIFAVFVDNLLEETQGCPISAETKFRSALALIVDAKQRAEKIVAQEWPRC